MSLGSAALIAFEGAHGTGKTTLALAVTALLKSQGVHAAYVPDVGRENPLVEASVCHGRSWDVTTHLHLVASQVAAEQRAAFGHLAVVSDRTLLSWLAYAQGVKLVPRTQAERVLCGALDGFCRAYLRAYDAIFMSRDLYDPRQTPDDRLRPSSPEIQDEIQRTIGQIAQAAGVRMVDIPVGLTIDARAQWVAAQCPAIIGRAP